MKTEPIEDYLSGSNENYKDIFVKKEKTDLACLHKDELYENHEDTAQFTYNINDTTAIRDVDDNSIFVKPEVEEDACYSQSISSFKSGANSASQEEDKNINNSIYKCDECDYMTKFRRNLRKHISSHTDVRPFKCDQCPYMAKTKTYLVCHQKVHEKVNPFKCDECDFETKAAIYLRRHIQRCHANKTLLSTFLCEKCDYISKDKDAMKNHQLNHLDLIKVENIKNENLDNKFGSKDFKLMYKLEVNENQKIHQKIGQFKCDKCSYVAKRKSNLKCHQQVHKDVTPIKCDKCEFETKALRYLKQHLKRCHENRTWVKTFGCGKCNYITKDKNGMKNHQLIHLPVEVKNINKDKTDTTYYKGDDSQLRPYECNQCSFRSKTKDGIQKHRLLHKVGKPFKCAKCSFRTTTKFLLDRHQLVHVQQRSFSCNECSFATKTEKYLERHKSIHHQKKLSTSTQQVANKKIVMKKYACLKCNFVSEFRRGIQQHEEETHSMVAIIK